MSPFLPELFVCSVFALYFGPVLYLFQFLYQYYFRELQSLSNFRHPAGIGSPPLEDAFPLRLLAPLGEILAAGRRNDETGGCLAVPVVALECVSEFALLLFPDLPNQCRYLVVLAAGRRLGLDPYGTVSLAV